MLLVPPNLYCLTCISKSPWLAISRLDFCAASALTDERQLFCSLLLFSSHAWTIGFVSVLHRMTNTLWVLISHHDWNHAGGMGGPMRKGPEDEGGVSSRISSFLLLVFRVFRTHCKILRYKEVLKRDDSKLYSYIGFCWLLTTTKKNRPTIPKL